MAFLKYFNLERDAVIGHRTQEFNLDLSPAFLEREKLLNQLRDNGNGSSFEAEVMLASGESRAILSSMQSIRVDESEAIICTFTDITERKLAEEYLRAMLDAAPDPTVVVNRKGEIVFVNEQLEKNFGYSHKQLIGKTIEKLIPLRYHASHPEHRQEYFAELRVRAMGAGLDLYGLRSNGSEFPIEVSLSPLATGEDTLVIASIRDITDRAQTEGKIRALASTLMVAEQEERRRISQILHDDLQQRLFAIKVQMSSLSEAYEKQDVRAFRENLQQLQAWLAESIVTTRNLSRDISPLILQREGFVEALKWLATQMKELHNLDVDIKPNGVKPNFDTNLATELFQAIRELLFNVVKHAETLRATVSLERLDGNIHITVKDGGKGFDAKTLTADWKDAHGLLNIHQRLNLLGCYMEISSEPGDGAQVLIDVPV